jgi:hypothetical protein
MEDARDEITHGMAASRPGGATGALALTACSGNGESASATDAQTSVRETAAPAPASPTPEQPAGGGFGGGRAPQLDQTQLAALAGCLELRGFEVPDGAANLQALFGGSPPSAELQEALSECGAELGVTLPGGFGGDGGGFGGGGQ